VRDPDRPLAALPLLSPAERHQILVEWNDTKRDFDPAYVFTIWFGSRQSGPPRPSRWYRPRRRFATASLDHAANRLARTLRGMGVGPDVPVGIFFDRSPEMCSPSSAVLKAGGAYVPLDPNYPAQRLQGMIEDSGLGSS